MLPFAALAQTEDDFLPEVRLMVLDSTEIAAQRFCKDVMAVAPGYKMAFVDREEVLMSKYFYDNANFETVRFEFQFGITEVTAPDSTVKKNRLARLIRITAELSVMTNIYNYIFNETHTPEKIMAISTYDKAVGYKGASYNSSLIADDYKAGYWTLSFFAL